VYCVKDPCGTARVLSVPICRCTFCRRSCCPPAPLTTQRPPGPTQVQQQRWPHSPMNLQAASAAVMQIKAYPHVFAERQPQCGIRCGHCTTPGHSNYSIEVCGFDLHSVTAEHRLKSSVTLAGAPHCSIVQYSCSHRLLRLAQLAVMGIPFISCCSSISSLISCCGSS
jgi:hypothetical protein